MSITLTTSQRAAADNPATQFRTLFDWETQSGKFQLAVESLTWSGLSYSARLLDPGQVVAEVGAAPDQLASVKTAGVVVANADGFFSRLRPDCYRQQQLTISEVFLDVPSDAIRQTAFTVTQAEMPDPTTLRVTGEDLFAKYRRQLVPANNVLITRSLYPNLPDGAALGRPIPLIFGRSFVPLTFVDATSYDTFVACVGCGTVGQSGYLAELFDFDGKGLPTLSPVVTQSPAPGQTPLTGAFSLNYAYRSGLIVTEVAMDPGIPTPVGVQRFLDLVMPQGSADTTPDRVLTEMLTNTWAGVCFDPTYIDSDSLLTAKSFYLANSMFFDGALTEQRPLEDWLGAWQHDCQTRFVQRLKLLLSLPNSRSATYSFGVSNIAEGSLTFTDVPVGQEEDRRIVHYRDRFLDWTFQYQDKQGNLVQSIEKYEIGSGANVELFSPFIGRRSMAQRAAQYWAAEQYFGKRFYTLNTTAKAAGVEENDLVTLTHSLVGLTNSLGLVTGVTRRNGQYGVSLKDFDPQVFSFGTLGPDTVGGVDFQRVVYNLQNDISVSFNFYYLEIVSHHLNATPLSLRQVVAPGFENLIKSKLLASGNGYTTNDSTCVIFVGGGQPTFTSVRGHLIGWDLSRFQIF